MAMSDDLVQEKAETEAAHEAVVAPEDTAASVASQEAPVVTSEPAPAPTDSSSDFAEFEKALQDLGVNSQNNRSVRKLVPHRVVDGTVMRVDKEGVLVDVGAKSEGAARNCAEIWR